MPFEQHQEKTYSREAAAVFQAALQAVARLEGKLLSSDPAKGHLTTTLPKTMLGKTVGERTHLECLVQPQEGGTRVVVDAYPLDALERKLMFGARKGVTESAVAWFLEGLDQKL